MNATTKRDWTERGQIQRRLRQMSRVLTVAYIVRREDHLTLPEIHQRLKEHFCIEVCSRTLHRDLFALIELGLVSKAPGSLTGVNGVTYQFIGQLYEPGVISGGYA